MIPGDVKVIEAIKDDEFRPILMSQGLHRYDQLMAQAKDTISNMTVMEYLEIVHFTYLRHLAGDGQAVLAGLGLDTILSRIIEQIDQEKEEDELH